MKDDDDKVALANFDKPLIEKDIFGEKTTCWKRHSKTLIVFFIILLLAIIAVVLILFLSKNKDDDDEKSFKILKNDKDFIKPNIRNNAEFKLIKIKNGMTGLLIHDPYGIFSHINFNIPYGSFIDTVDGLSHLGEHLIFGGSEKYPNIYTLLNLNYKGIETNAATGGLYQMYYTTILYNYKFEKILDILTDSFRYPLYKEDIIKKEIQPVNSEFYRGINSFWKIVQSILMQLSSEKSPFHRNITCGNNETLKPDESNILSKKLKGYHMAIKNPKNIFFALYSNKTMNDLEKYVEKYLNYKMHNFPDNEIDIEDKIKLEENIKNLNDLDIFDEKLYEHGIIYLNSSKKQNLLILFFNLGNINYKDIQFELVDYINYLFKSESLFQLFINKDYIAENLYLDVSRNIEFENNNIFELDLELSDEGVNNIEDVLLIIYKYIEILKQKGNQKELFENFIKYKKSDEIIKFKKESQSINDLLEGIIRNYRKFGENQIFSYGKPSIQNYSEKNLMECLNKLKFEKSFFILNTISDSISEKTNLFLETKKKTLQYYKKDIYIGKIPDEFKNKITKSEFDYENLEIRKINKYFSNSFERITPCFKNKPNNCEELKEFDYEHENAYKGELLEEKDEHYKTYYQIDKSSESNLIKSYLEIKFAPNAEFKDKLKQKIIRTYIETLIREINEFENIKISNFGESTLSFSIESFKDKTQIIFEDIIKYLLQEPNSNEFNFVKSSTKSYKINEAKTIDLTTYNRNIFLQFLNAAPSQTDIDQIINTIDQFNIDEFTILYFTIFQNIKSIKLLIAGNIDKSLVEIIHNYLKGNFTINSEINLMQTKLKDDIPNSLVLNYYQKSELLDEVDNSLCMAFFVDKSFMDYVKPLTKFLQAIFMEELRFNLSNSYTPSVEFADGVLLISEQGRYKNVIEMENDINTVLYNIINGKLTVNNYDEIIESLNLKTDTNNEKTPEYLFDNFIKNKTQTQISAAEGGIEYPKNFSKFIELVSPIFTNPRRFSALIFSKDISDEDIEKIMKGKINNTNYILNEEIEEIYTNDIEYIKNQQP